MCHRNWGIDVKGIGEKKAQSFGVEVLAAGLAADPARSLRQLPQAVMEAVAVVAQAPAARGH